MANIHPREVSIITQGESDHDDNIDVEDDVEDDGEDIKLAKMVWKKLSLLLRILVTRTVLQ